MLDNMRAYVINSLDNYEFEICKKWKIEIKFKVWNQVKSDIYHT